MSSLQRYFPAIAIFACIVAYIWPDWLAKQKFLIVYLLGAVMFCMGASLKVHHFIKSLQQYPLILLALLLQYGLMPFMAWQLSTWAGLSAVLTAGMILVGSVPGGTASNVICYLSKGDVALSITITTISTFIAIVMTPLLAYVYLSHTVDVPIGKIMLSILYIVVLPVSLGVALHHFVPKLIRPVQIMGADLSILIICFIIAVIIALNADNLLKLSFILTLLVIAHNLCGLFAGYIVTLVVTRNSMLSRTIAIEVGMQNSGLAVALAVKFYGPASALPGALFSVIHNITGALAAAYWSKHKH